MMKNVQTRHFSCPPVTHLVQPGAQQSRDLLDQSVGGQEGVVLGGQLLHLLLVLIQLLEVVGRHGRNTAGLGLVNVLLVTEQTDAKLLTRDVLQPGREEILALQSRLRPGNTLSSSYPLEGPPWCGWRLYMICRYLRISPGDIFPIF